MKKLLIIVLFILGAFFGNAQEKVAYSKVIKADSVIADGIFVSIKEWLSMEFKKGNNAIELEDKEAGLIVVNANSEYRSTKRGLSYMWADGFINYKINIQIRDGRFKVTITNFVHKGKTNTEHLSVLTTQENSGKKAAKKVYDEVWNDLKLKSKDIAEIWFGLFATVDFSNYKQDTSDDW